MTSDEDKMQLDEEEREILEAFEKGEIKSVDNLEEEMRMAQAAAANYVKKDKRVNIRLSGADLTMLKMRAVEEGLPYQTLLSSVLHKYATGRLVPADFTKKDKP